MDDALDVLNELESLLTTNGSEGYVDNFAILEFISNQRSVYLGVGGDCAG